MNRSVSIREPAVAGQFYPGTATALRAQIEGLLKTTEAQPAIGLVLPHAGYMYSGGVAGQTVSAVSVPDHLVILGPNHTGYGPPVSVFPSGSWSMPFGEVPIDAALADRILKTVGPAEADHAAHMAEHSIEVQLPFLHYRRKEPFSFVPITLSTLSAGQCREVGEGMAQAVKESGQAILLVASSDMTHYESDEAARRKDAEAIERILALDPDGLYSTVRSRRISMCGVIPTTVMLHAARALGATKARLVRYATSGEASGDYDRVVGYAGIIVA